MPDPSPSAPSPPSRGCALVVTLLLLAPSLALSVAALDAGLSAWSWAVLLGLLLLAAGVALAQRRALAAGLVLLLAPWLVRAVFVAGDDRSTLITLPAGDSSRLLSRLYPEPDGALAAAALLARTRPLQDPESAQFAQILRQAYANTTPPAPMFPTPAIATYLGLQSPQAFDTLLLRPPEQRIAADGAVVFLHGYAGNFYVYCWEMAQAAAAANLVTLCPSVGASGAWWEPDGAATLNATLEYAHRIGMNRVYLAGLSNGAAGASVLALADRDRLSGLVLISGGRAAAPPPALPVLVIQGAADRMMLAASARAYARGRPNVQYHELSGGHLIFLSDTTRVRPLIARFLSGLEQRATTLKKP